MVEGSATLPGGRWLGGALPLGVVRGNASPSWGSVVGAGSQCSRWLEAVSRRPRGRRLRLGLVVSGGWRLCQAEFPFKDVLYIFTNLRGHFLVF